MANWTDLPQDLLRMISDFCNFPYHIKMQYVCKSWQSILEDSSSRRRDLPWLLMFHEDEEEEVDEDEEEDYTEYEEEDPAVRDLFCLSKQKIFTIRLLEMCSRKRCFWSFQKGWLMIVDWFGLNICLFHPWSKKQVDLPQASTFKNRYSGSKRRHRSPNYSNTVLGVGIVKAALTEDADLVVVVYANKDLAFCRPGDKAWTDIDYDEASWEDVIYHKGRFYAITQLGAVYLLRIEKEGVNVSLWMEGLTEDIKTYEIFYLVPDLLTDSMFLINRDPAKYDVRDPHRWLIHVDIYKTPLGVGVPNEKPNKWMKVESLGDRIMFLGNNSPMIIIASEFPGFKGNLIYFSDYSDDYVYVTETEGCVTSVFNVEVGTVVEQLFADRFHHPLTPPLWIVMPPYSS